MADQQFCLRWNNHQSTLISVFDSLLENGTLVDCTLAAEGQYLKAHKVVLSACSPYLETLLSQHYEKHPIVILKDVKFTELKSMMDYMYRGEVNISQDQLGTFLKAAESLQIKGLSDNGSDGDGRDVGSTSKGPPPRKTQPAPTTRPAEPQRPDVAPASPVHRSRDGSISPSSRKRRRIRRNSQGEDANMGDSHLDSNSCDLPIQAQSTPIVPNIPATVTSSITTTPIIKTSIVKPEQTELVNRIIDSSNLNSLPPESGLLKEKMEPISEPLLEPKTEYLDDANNDDSVEDLTLDDDDEMDEMDMSNMSNMSNMSRPGPSHGNDVSQMSNQGFVPWQLGGNQTGTDEVFMAAQEAVQAHRGDSQDWSKSFESKLQEGNSSVSLDQTLEDLDDGLVDFDLSLFKEFLKDPTMSIVSANPSTGKPEYTCPRCSKIYSYPSTLLRHLKFECGQKPKFSCPHCPYKSHRKENIKSHVIAKHEKGKKMKCPLCVKTFVHKFRWLEHIRLFHYQEGELEPSLPQEVFPVSQRIAGVDQFPQTDVLLSPLSQQRLGYSQVPYTSTPKKGHSSKLNTIAVMDVPKINKLPPLGFQTQEISSTLTSATVTRAKETPRKTTVNLPDIKQETILEITDSIDPLPTPDCSVDDILRVIF